MHTRQLTPARRRRARSRRGFTLVELMVAIIIMTVGVLGLASTSAVVARMVGGGGQQTIAANVASSRFERLHSVQCSAITSGSATTRGMTEHWHASFVAGKLYSVIDTVTYTAADGRARKPLVFQSYLRC